MATLSPIVRDGLALFLGTSAAAGFGLIVRALVKALLSLAKLPDRVDVLDAGQKNLQTAIETSRTEERAAIQKLGADQAQSTRVLLRVTDYQNKAHRATLQCLSGQPSNGNVTRAMEAIDKADEELKAYTIDGMCEDRG